MKWMIEINNLDPQQSRILEDVTTNDEKTHWIAGYAGTGKTIVITHAIERIIARSHNASVCFLTYTHALKDLVHSGLSEAARNRVVVETIDTFGSNNEHYDYVLVDEIQDIKEDNIDNIFDRADHVIAAGDPDQSIYLGRVQPSELKKLLGNAKKHTLKNIHRLSLKTFQLAATVLPDAQIVAGANVKDEGNEGKLIRADTLENEYARVYAEATRVAAIEQPCCILFPTHDQIYSFAEIIASSKRWGKPPAREKKGRIVSYEDFNNFFLTKQSPLRFLGSANGSLPESDEKKIIYLMTYHSAKGLDFNNVFLPDLSVDVKLDAKWKQMSKPENERRHFFVAITRCKENVYFSYHGEPHSLLAELMELGLEEFTPPRSVFSR